MKQIKIMFFMFIVCLIACFVGSFFKDAQASTDTHKPCFYTHTCLKNHTYADGHTTDAKGNVIATAVPTKQNTSSQQQKSEHSKKDQTGDNDTSYQEQQKQWDDDKHKRIGDTQATTINQALNNTQPTIDTKQIQTPTQPFLTIVSQATDDSAVCYVKDCEVDIMRLQATNGLYVMAHVSGEDINILILKYGNGYKVNSGHLSDIIVMKQGYIVNVY